MEADVFIYWGHSGFPESVRKQFTRPTEFILMPTPPSVKGQNKYTAQLYSYGWPHPIRNIVSRAKPGLTPLRVGLLGFSESCQGVRAFLSSADAAYIDTVVAIDGIHTTFNGTPNKDRDNWSLSGIAPWIEYARIAASLSIDPGEGLPLGRRHCIITHSSIKPPFVSTTETASAILSALFGDLAPSDPVPDGIIDVVHNPPIQLHGNSINGYSVTQYVVSPNRYFAHQNGLYVFGYNNIDPTGINDHIYQAQVVLPNVLEKIVVPNWNSVDPKSGLCMEGSQAFDQAAEQMVTYGFDSSSSNPQSCVLDPPVTMPEYQDEADGYLHTEKWGGTPTYIKDREKKEKYKRYAINALWMFTAGSFLYSGAKIVGSLISGR